MPYSCPMGTRSKRGRNHREKPTGALVSRVGLTNIILVESQGIERDKCVSPRRCKAK